MKLKIKELREELQMTQKELAERISSAQRNVSNWELGVSEPDLDTIQQLRDIFGVSFEELFGLSESVQQEQYAPIDRAILRRVKQLRDEQKRALLQFLNTFDPTGS